MFGNYVPDAVAVNQVNGQLNLLCISTQVVHSSLYVTDILVRVWIWIPDTSALSFFLSLYPSFTISYICAHEPFKKVGKFKRIQISTLQWRLNEFMIMVDRLQCNFTHFSLVGILVVTRTE